MRNIEIDYTWEDQVDAIVNDLILKLYKQHYPEKVQEIREFVKEYLENKLE